VSSLYTKNGVPLQVHGQAVFNQAGRHVGRIQGSKVYAPTGRYVGTIIGERLVHRSTDAAAVGSAYAPAAGAPSATAHAVASALWGDEPDLGGP
jgi:hypothetical protein